MRGRTAGDREACERIVVPGGHGWKAIAGDGNDPGDALRSSGRGPGCPVDLQADFVVVKPRAGAVVNVLDTGGKFRAGADVEDEPTARHQWEGQQEVQRYGSTAHTPLCHGERNGTTPGSEVSSALLEPARRVYLGGLRRP